MIESNLEIQVKCFDPLKKFLDNTGDILQGGMISVFNADNQAELVSVDRLRKHFESKGKDRPLIKIETKRPMAGNP